jgi:hypothetical protein|tara:strand:- start:79 stop:303 length:225 start_codon:yes stop_codon:yes gene_type:complete
MPGATRLAKRLGPNVAEVVAKVAILKSASGQSHSGSEVLGHLGMLPSVLSAGHPKTRGLIESHQFTGTDVGRQG